MNSKQLGTIILVGLILAGIGGYVLKKNSADYTSSAAKIGQKVLGDFDINQIERVRIATGDEEVNLVKNENVWSVAERGNYPADFENISEFITKCWDLKVMRSQKVGPSQLSRLELVKPGDGESGAGTLVEFQDASGKPVKSILLGKEHFSQSNNQQSQFGGGGFANGRWVMPLEEGAPVSLVDENFSSVKPDPGSWIEKDFVRVSKIKSVTVNHPDEADSFIVSKETETGQPQMDSPADGETFDTAKGNRVLGALGFPSFNDVLPADTETATGLDNPILAKIETFEGFQYDVKIGHPEGGEDYYMTLEVSADIKEERDAPEEETEEAKAEAETAFQAQVKTLKEKLAKEEALEGWIYKVAKWTVDPLIFTKADLYKEKEDETENEGGAAIPPAPSGADGVPDLLRNLNDPLNPLRDQ